MKGRPATLTQQQQQRKIGQVRSGKAKKEAKRNRGIAGGSGRVGRSG